MTAPSTPEYRTRQGPARCGHGAAIGSQNSRGSWPAIWSDRVCRHGGARDTRRGPLAGQIDGEGQISARWVGHTAADAQLGEAIALARQDGKCARADLGVKRPLISRRNLSNASRTIGDDAHEDVDAAGRAFRVCRAMQIGRQLQAFLQFGPDRRSPSPAPRPWINPACASECPR